MATDVTSLIMKFEAQTSDAENQIESLDRKTRDYEKTAESATQQNDGFFSGIGGGLAKFGLMATGIGAVVDIGGGMVSFLKDAAQASIDEQVGIDRLNGALKNNIPGWDGNTSAIEDYIAKQQGLAFADDQLRDSLGFLVGKTGDLAKAQELQSVAMDLARSKNITLEQATKAVTKADDDSIGMLQKLGIAVDKNMTAEQNLAVIRQSSAGAAQTYAQSAAGSMEIMQNSMSNALEDVGSKIMTGIQPLLQGFATFISSPEFQGVLSALIDIIGQGLSGAFTFLSDTVAAVWPFIQSVIIPALLDIFNNISRWWTEIQPQLQVVMQVIGQLIADTWAFISGTILPILQGIFDQLGRWWTEIQPALATVFQTIQDTVVTVWPIVQGIIQAGMDFIGNLWNSVWPGIQTTFEGVWQSIQGAIEVGWSLISGIWNTAMALLQGDWEGAWEAIKTMFEGVWNGMVDFLGGIWTTIQGAFDIALGAIKTVWETVWGAVSTFVTDTWNGITTFVGDAINGIKQTISDVINGIKTTWEDFWTGVGTFISDTWDTISTTVSDGFNAVWDTIKNFPGQVWDSIVNIGTQIINGILEGLGSMAGQILEWLKGLAGQILDGVKEFFGIQSPSTVMAEVGENLMLGFLQGAQSQEAKTVNAFKGILGSVNDTWEDNLPNLGLPSIGGRFGANNSRSIRTSSFASIAPNLALAGVSGGSSTVHNYFIDGVQVKVSQEQGQLLQALAKKTHTKNRGPNIGK